MINKKAKYALVAEKARAIAQEKRADKENIIDGGDSE